MDVDLWDCLGRVKLIFIAKFQRTDLVIYSHSREGKTLSYSQINIVGQIILYDGQGATRQAVLYTQLLSLNGLVERWAC